MRIEFGKVDTTWEKYGLVEARINYNDKPSPYKAIIKDGKLVAILGKDYVLVPNEEIVSLSREVAEEVGAKPFRVRYARSNCIYNKAETKVYANYIMPRPFDIEGRDKVNIGFSFHNSIDGSSAFSVVGFSFRRACENGVLYGYEELTRFMHKHTKGLAFDKESIKKVVEEVLGQMRKLIDGYRKLVHMELNEEIAEAIAKSQLPRYLLPDYIKIEKDIVKSFDPSVDLWTFYNDVTANIWHNVRQDIERKRQCFNILHSIIPVVKA